MQFFAVPILALLATGAIAMPSDLETRELQARVNCREILPACAGGHISGQTNCRCPGQRETCDLWTCPGAPPNVMVCGQAGSGCVWI
ncbi:hypothetical protein GQ53DRAFT_780361 [Thozetella sp. PMI_491]|nr:hypothetical protein GQ53DRAFT_780361 [Thozetella sp. PMI_491]